jgi:hypothetical protein
LLESLTVERLFVFVTAQNFAGLIRRKLESVAAAVAFRRRDAVAQLIPKDLKDQRRLAEASRNASAKRR